MSSLLKSVHLKNIAGFKDCENPFANGLNVLTCERGTGKSAVLKVIYTLLIAQIFERDGRQEGASRRYQSGLFVWMACIYLECSFRCDDVSYQVLHLAKASIKNFTATQSLFFIREINSLLHPPLYDTSFIYLKHMFSNDVADGEKAADACAPEKPAYPEVDAECADSVDRPGDLVLKESELKQFCLSILMITSVMDLILQLLILMAENQKATENRLNAGKYEVISGSAMLGDTAYDRR